MNTRVFNLELKTCSKLCPNYESVDGNGYGEGRTFCKVTNDAIKSWEFVDNFPKFCKLPKK